MNKENIFKFISVIIIPILIIELLFNILYLFRDEINPIIRSLVFRVNSNSTDAKINEMWVEYANSSNFDHISHLSHKRAPYEGNIHKYRQKQK